MSKDFSDDNTAEVDVTLSCNTGLPLEQTTTIAEGDPVSFVVGDFEPGTLDCAVTEVVPAGYPAFYEDGNGVSEENCSWSDLQTGQFACQIENNLDNVFDGSVEIDEGECQGLLVFPGQGASCTINNTRLFEGIPTLSQYGLGVLALTALGMGFVAFRRFG